MRDLDPAVERVILRCLEQDPARRPPSALAVAAALPGGDPLAAALAAGETPSPEMVAAAGRTDAVPLAQGLVTFVAILAGLIALVTWKGRDSFIPAIPFDKPPAVLEDRARSIIDRFGYRDAPSDMTGAFMWSLDYLQWVRANRKGADRWQVLETGRTPAAGYWYRTSPRPLVPIEARARPTGNDPPLVVTGMMLVVVDTTGRLLEFHRIPEQREASPPDTAAAPSVPDWQVVFDLTGWPRDRFTPATPQWTPRGVADARAAWTGTLAELGDTPLRLEAAAFRGRVTYVQTVGPWARPTRQETPPIDRVQRAFGLITSALTLLMLVGAAAMARRNLILGRGDRAGATRVAFFIFGTLMASWVVGAHHTSDFGREQERFLQQCADAMLPAALFWLTYLAIEPWIRRHWPSSLVSWTRLLSRGVYGIPSSGGMC